MKAVIDCRKKIDSATQQKPKHKIHTRFPRTDKFVLLTRENFVSSGKKLRLPCKKELKRRDQDDISKASGMAGGRKRVAGSV